MALANLHKHRIPDADRVPAGNVLSVLSEPQPHEQAHIVVVGPSGRRAHAVIPASMMAAFVELTSSFVRNGTATVVDEEKEVSPEDASAFLGMSRPMFMHRLRQGDIPFRLVGTHHRIKTSDLEAFQSAERSQQDALAEIGEHTDEVTSSHGV